MKNKKTPAPLFDPKIWQYVKRDDSFRTSYIEWFFKLTGEFNPFFPLAFIGSGKSLIGFEELGKSIYPDAKQSLPVFATHYNRLKKYKAIKSSVRQVIIFILTLILSTPILLVMFSKELALSYSSSALVPFTFIYLLSYPAGILLLKIASILTARHYGDTLSIVAGVRLLIILDQEPSLSDPLSKRIIISNLQQLRRALVLLQQTFNINTSNETHELYDHFYHMEKFVRDMEQTVILSSSKTLINLKEDFSKFIPILISSQYGDFKWKKIKRNAKITPKPKLVRFAEGFVKFLASVTPFILILSIFIIPKYYLENGVNPNWVMVASLSWILLVIDAYLNLGIVERASGVLKTMKDLN